MNEKKLTIFLAGFFTALFSLHSLDYGGSIGTYTKLCTPSNPGNEEFKNCSLKQEEILTLWIRHNFTPTSFIAAEADARLRSIRPKLGKKLDSNSDVIIPDVKLLRFTKLFPIENNKIMLNAGRFYFADISSTVLSQTADGASISFDFKKIRSKAYANYTGLLNAQNIQIINKQDSKYALDSKKGWYFNASYANFGAQVELPYLFANQTLSAEYLASIGFDGLEKGSSGYNRMWGSLGLNGFLHKNLCYVLTTTFGSELEDGISNLTKITFTLLPDYKNMTLSLSGLYASGEQFGLKPFRGFTSQTAVNSHEEPEYTSLVKGGLSASIKPAEQLLLSASANAVFDFPESKLEYSGTEAGLNANIQIFSDLNINAGLTQFFAKKDKQSKGCFILTATLAF